MLIRAFLFAECCAFRKTAYNSQIGSTSGASCCLRGRVRMPHPLQVDGNFRTPRGSRFTLLAHSKLRKIRTVRTRSRSKLRDSHTRFAVRTRVARFARWRSLLPRKIRTVRTRSRCKLRGSHSSRIPSCAIRTVRTRSRSKLRGSHTRFTADAFFTQMLYTDYR